MSDHREFHPAVCWLCKRPAVWLVFEDKHVPDAEWLMTCDEHKTAAFS